MLFKDIPIRRKLMRVITLIITVVLVVSCLTFFFCELYSFRKTTRQNLSTLGKIIAANSTAALAFDDQVASKEILAALKAEPHIMAAALYDRGGHLFAQYAAGSGTYTFPEGPGSEGYYFTHWHLEGFQPVFLEKKQLGTLYLRSDLGAIFEMFRVYGFMVLVVVILSFLLAYGLSRILQKSISDPILALAGTAKSISEKKDYSMRAVKSGQDELGSLTDAFNDMLEQIQVQNRALNEFNQTLEQKVRHRTAELETLNQELEAFSYSISHDLRAPLRGIIGFASILVEDYSSRLDDEAIRITGIIKDNTLKMGHLIDDLLAFSRMSRQDINMTNIDMATMVHEVIEEITQSDKHSRIRWVVGDTPPVCGDIHAMRQVWINLISNAVKYSANKQEPCIEIGSYKRDGENIFFVKDNGVGFDEKYKHKLFKVFQRLHSAEDFEGTGVGLAIVEKIISKHDGKVWAEAALKNGASFYFSLPDKQKLT
jgi:signal transduction histidine kinase